MNRHDQVAALPPGHGHVGRSGQRHRPRSARRATRRTASHRPTPDDRGGWRRTRRAPTSRPAGGGSAAGRPAAPDSALGQGHPPPWSWRPGLPPGRRVPGGDRAGGRVLHVVGISAHLPKISFGWPWQTAGGGHHDDQRQPGAVGAAEDRGHLQAGPRARPTSTSVFTHKVSKNIGPLPCWYASTFYAVGHASATVNLNPGPAWWAPGTGHYLLQVLQPAAGREAGPGGGEHGAAAPAAAAVGARRHDRQPARPARCPCSTAGPIRGSPAGWCCGPSSRRRCCTPRLSASPSTGPTTRRPSPARWSAIGGVAGRADDPGQLHPADRERVRLHAGPVHVTWAASPVPAR